MTEKNHTTRVGNDFKKEIEDIKKQRIKSGIDKKKKSDRVLSNLITKHKFWKKIKQEIIELSNDEILEIEKMYKKKNE